MNLVQQEIGNRIKSSREDRGFSQRQLASKVGVNKDVINKYERGEVKEPSVITITKIAKSLKVSETLLCFGPKFDHVECDLKLDQYLDKCKGLSIEQKCYVIATLERIVTLDEVSTLMNRLKNSSLDSHSIL